MNTRPKLLLPLIEKNNSVVLEKVGSQEESLSKSFVEVTIIPHIFNLPVGYHLHSLFLLASLQDPFCSVSDIFQDSNLKQFYLSFLINARSDNVDLSNVTHFILHPSVQHFRDEKIKENSDKEINFDAYHSLFPDLSLMMFTNQFDLGPFRPKHIHYIYSIEEITTAFQNSTDPQPKYFVSLTHIREVFPFFIYDPVSSVISARLFFLIYSQYGFYYLAFACFDDESNVETNPKCVIFSDGRTVHDNLPENDVIVIYACYVPNRYHQKITVQRTLTETKILHQRKIAGDDIFLNFLKSLRPKTEFDIDIFEGFVYNNLYDPFQFLVDCKFGGNRDDTLIMATYLYHLTNKGNNSNMEAFARIFNKTLQDIQSSKIFQTYLLLQIFLIYLKKLIDEVYSQNYGEIINILINMVSCCPICHRGCYEMMLRALHYGFYYYNYSLSQSSSEVNLSQFDSIRYLILDLVGQNGYDAFCNLIALPPSQDRDTMRGVDVNNNFLSQHLVHVFNLEGDKQKIVVFVNLVYGQQYNESWICQEIPFTKGQYQQFQPTQALQLYNNRLVVASTLFP